MPRSPYNELPLGILQDLFVKAVQELLEAMEQKEEREIAVKVKKKQVELIYAAIIEKRKSGNI